jgi:uroporphyrinogen-III decarboxylase
MTPKLREALDGLAERIDPKHLASSECLQMHSWAYLPVERVPVLLLDVSCPDWPVYPYHEAFEDPEKMFWNELTQIHLAAYLRDDRMLTVRASYGSGTVASLFGARVISINDEFPWIDPLRTAMVIRKVVERGLPDLNTGLGKKVLDAERLYRDYLDEHPVLSRNIHISLCDTQGPLDTALLLWGQELYLGMLDAPDLVHDLLNLITEITIAFTRAQKEIVREPVDQAWHFWYRVQGGVRVVDDVSMNLSPAMYREFSRPYNERILAAFGGGYIHYCGHHLKTQPLRLATQGLRGIEMGFDNPERNVAYTADSICDEAREHRVAILWIREGMPERRLKATTGLVYGCRIPELPWAEAGEHLKCLKELYSN